MLVVNKKEILKANLNQNELLQESQQISQQNKINNQQLQQQIELLTKENERDKSQISDLIEKNIELVGVI